MKHTDQYYMQQALRLAARGRLDVSPNPMVGCVIVKNGQIIGEGYHQKYGQFHAEINALKIAGDNAKGSTLYVTLEPCCHTGNTGSCTQAIIDAGIKTVVIAMLDPNPKVTGNGIKCLEQAKIETKIGVLRDQAKELNKIFVKYHTKKSPYIFAKHAMSLDGKMTVIRNDSKSISSQQASVKTHQLRNICDAIIIGKQTLISDNPTLNVRLDNIDIKNPIRFVVFNEIVDMDANWKILDQSIAKTIFVCNRVSESLQQRLQSLGVDVWILSTDNGQISLKSLIKKIADSGITSLLVEGGRRLLDSFASEKLVDEFVCYISPVMIANSNPKDSLIFNNVEMLGQDVMISAIFKDYKNV